MSVKIICDQLEGFNIGVFFINEYLHEQCKILHGSSFFDSSHPFSCFEFYGQENVCCTVPSVFIIVFFRTSRLHSWVGMDILFSHGFVLLF